MIDIRSLDLNLLHALNSLLDQSSVTRAAEQMRVSQSTMSGMLARLRSAFDDPLFVRTRRGLLPTDRAAAMRPRVTRILSEIGELFEGGAFDPNATGRTFVVAATDYAQAVLLPPLASRITGHLRMAWVPLPSHPDAHQRLAQGELDLWLALPSSPRPSLRMKRLFDEHYVCVARTDHPHRSRRMSCSTYCKYDHVLVSPRGGGFSSAVDEALEAHGLSRRIRLSLSAFASVARVLEHTDMLAMLPSRIVDQYPTLRAIDVPLDVPPFTLSAVWHERAHCDPAHRWLREQLRSVLDSIR